MTAAEPKLRWFQFSLRTLMVVVTLCAIACSWLAVKLRQAEQQRKAVAAIERLGGQVIYDWEISPTGGLQLNSKPTGPQWLRGMLGNDLFWKVRCVVCANDTLSLEGLDNLKTFDHLQGLWLSGSATDEDVAKLRQEFPNCEISVTRE